MILVQLRQVGWLSVDGSVVNQIRGHGDWGYAFSAYSKIARGIRCWWEKTALEANECMSDQRSL